MSDYNSSLTAEQIESRLIGGIVFNEAMRLTDRQKEQARVNIGAGTSSTGLQISGFFDTYDELVETITSPSVGETYAVGLQDPYNIYIWDGLNQRWVANGFIRGADGSDASVTAESIATALGYTPANASEKVTRAKLANDALYSPIVNVTSDIRAITQNDLGKTIEILNANADVTLTLPMSEFQTWDTGFEFAVFWNSANSVKLTTSGDFYLVSEEAGSFIQNGTATLNARFAMVAFKKISSDTLLVTGSAEVTS